MSPKTKSVVASALAIAAVAIAIMVFAAWALVPGLRRFIRNDDLNQAALAGDSARITKLLGEGVNVNGQGMHGMTPIMSAAEGGHLKVVELLVERGADVNGHNSSGSALMWAVESGNEEVVSYFLKSGADAGWKDSLGGSALEFARKKKNANIVRLLEEWRKSP